MLKVKEIEFADSLGVMYDLKDAHNLKTLDETNKLLSQTDVDTVVEVLMVSYNRAHPDKKLNQSEFVDLMEKNEIGFIKMVGIFKDVIEHLMFSGMTPQEIEDQKNLLKNLK